MAMRAHAERSETACNHCWCCLFRPQHGQGINKQLNSLLYAVWRNESRYLWSLLWQLTATKKVRNNGQCLSEAEKRKTKLQTHSVINSAPCERSFHERAAAGGHIEDRLNGPVIQKSLPKCNWLWLVPKKWHILAMALLPLCRRGCWTLDCGLKQNVLLLFRGSKEEFPKQTGNSRQSMCPGTWILRRRQWSVPFCSPWSWRDGQGTSQQWSQPWIQPKEHDESVHREGATSCKNNVAFCRMGLTQNSFVLQDSSSSASIGTVCLLSYWTSTMSHEI